MHGVGKRFVLMLPIDSHTKSVAEEAKKLGVEATSITQIRGLRVLRTTVEVVDGGDQIDHRSSQARQSAVQGRQIKLSLKETN